MHASGSPRPESGRARGSALREPAEAKLLLPSAGESGPALPPSLLAGSHTPALPRAPGPNLPGAASACLRCCLACPRLSCLSPTLCPRLARLRRGPSTRNSANGPAPQCAARPEPSPPALVRHALGETISTLPICKAHPAPPGDRLLLSAPTAALPTLALALSACRCVLESLPQSSTRRVGTFVGKLCTDLRHLPI